MSGDRNAVLSALALSQNNVVVVVGPKNTRTSEMYRYFASKVGSRAMVLATETRDEAERIVNLAKRPDVNKDALKEIKNKLPLSGKVHFHSPSFATQVVANAFSQKALATRNTLSSFWSNSSYDNFFAHFLKTNGFQPEKRYAFLWCKKGSIHDEKAHHYTDRRSWAMLAANIASNSNFFPVFTGEDIGLYTWPNLTEFWKTWEATYGRPMTRDIQLRLWAYIAQKMGSNCCAIGMRSGMMEVPALLGIKTLYLEEVENAQSTRMATWLAKVDTWYRGLLFQPLGAMQTVYWTRLMVEYRSYPSVLKKLQTTAEAMAYHATLEARVCVSIALTYIRRKAAVDNSIMKYYDATKNLVLAYLGYDIDRPETAMVQLAINTIVEWVNAKSPVYGTGQDLARGVIELGIPLAIEGGIPTRRERTSKKPSDEELQRLKQKKAEAKLKKHAVTTSTPAASPALYKMDLKVKPLDEYQ
jgi:hypothetical protein